MTCRTRATQTQDLGSGGTLLLPDETDAGGTAHHLAVGAGKDTNIYVVDRDNMGKFNPSSNNAIYQELPNALAGGAWSMPAYFNNTVYYAGERRPPQGISHHQCACLQPLRRASRQIPLLILARLPA